MIDFPKIGCVYTPTQLLAAVCSTRYYEPGDKFIVSNVSISEYNITINIVGDDGVCSYFLFYLRDKETLALAMRPIE